MTPLTISMHTPSCGSPSAARTEPVPDECWIAKIAADAALAEGYGNALVRLREDQLTRKQLLSCSALYVNEIALRCGEFYGRRRHTKFALSLPLIGRSGDRWVIEFPRRTQDGPPLRVTTFWDGTAVRVERPDDDESER